MEPNNFQNPVPNKKKGNILLTILGAVAIVAASFWLYTYLAEQDTPSSAGNNLPANSPSSSQPVAADFPVAVSHPSVLTAEKLKQGENDLFRYYFGGKITQASTVPGGTKIVLENSAGLPEMILATSTKPASIAPGNDPKITPREHSALKPGVYVQVLMYYQVISKTWVLRDIYIPTDKN